MPPPAVATANEGVEGLTKDPPQEHAALPDNRTVGVEGTYADARPVCAPTSSWRGAANVDGACGWPGATLWAQFFLSRTSSSGADHG